MLTFYFRHHDQALARDRKTRKGQAAARLLFLWSTQTDNQPEFPSKGFEPFTVILCNHQFFFFPVRPQKTLNRKRDAGRLMASLLVVVSDH